MDICVLSGYISLGSMSAAAVFTAEFVERFNKLFDIFNSSKLYSSDLNKEAFTNTKEQSSFLNETGFSAARKRY